MRKTCEIWNTMRALLNLRLDLVRDEETPRWATIRNFFYEARNRYLRANLDRLTIDSKDKNPYIATHKIIKVFCIEHGEEFGIPSELWWRLRDKLNIHPQGRAVSRGESGEFLITEETRSRVVEECSFILVCEKDTIVHNLLPALRDENYKLNIVSTGGNSPADVQEVVLQLREELGEEATFYILVAHDYDSAGVRILVTLKQRYEKVIDIGVNRFFIDFLKKSQGFDARLAEEQTENKNYQHDLRKIIEEGLCDEYSLTDFEYLQGELFERMVKGKPKDTWRGKRIELDAIEVMYGIQPFVDYILKKIREECKVWDLSRIGITDFELKKPRNEYHKIVGDFEEKIGRAYGLKTRELSKTLNAVLEIVRETLTQPEEYSNLEKEYRGEPERHWRSTGPGGSYRFYASETKGVSEVKEEYEKQINHEWIKDYSEDLEKINTQIEKYEGDVREGEDDLSKQVDELQDKLNTAVDEDPSLKGFKEKLSEVDWGEKKLEAIEIPSARDEIQQVIDALEKRLEELKNDV